MSEIRQKIKVHLLNQGFLEEIIKETFSGFKINIPFIANRQINGLYKISKNVDMQIKRSGTGIVILISL